MSVVVGVKKSGSVAIAADTQSSQGEIILPGDSKSSAKKILKIGKSYLGITGSSSHLLVIQSLYKNHPDLFNLSNTDAIFETFRSIHKKLVDDYYLLTEEVDPDQEYESNQMFGIVISSRGLFLFQSYREVSEFENFWASGSGAVLALGSMESTYRSNRSAKSIAEEAVRVACRYDKGCGLPITSHSLRTSQ